MNQETVLLIQRASNAYFWIFLILLISKSLEVSVSLYKKVEISKNRSEALGIIFWTLWILSMYYK